MLRALVFPRLVSAALIVMISSGGGGLPVLDGLIFHTRGRAAEALRPHYEATGGCHADGCAIRSTAHLARCTPSLGTAGLVISPPEMWISVWLSPTPLSNSPFGQPLSRAPPLFG